MVGVNKSLKELSAKVEGNSGVKLCRKEAILVRQREKKKRGRRRGSSHRVGRCFLWSIDRLLTSSTIRESCVPDP